MALTMFVTTLLIVSVAAQASGHDLQTQSSPAFLIVGKRNGEISRCLFDSPENCETFDEGKESHVMSTVVHGEYLYAALYSKQILRCEWERKNSCEVYYTTEGYIFTLTVSDGYLYAGGHSRKGIVLRCELNQPNSCSLLQSFPSWVKGIYELNNYMYIATDHVLSCCSKGAKLQCSNVRVDEDLGQLYSVSHLGNTIITLRITEDDVRYYNLTTSNNMNYVPKQKMSIPRHTFRVTVFKRNVYVLKATDNIETSEEYNGFKEFARHDNAYSISFTYATHRMQHNAYGVSKCFEQRSSPTVFNYGVEHRAMLEARVVAGRLQDARGAVLDTRRADRGYSGPAAVFNYDVQHRAMLEARVVAGRLQDARGAVLDTRRADRGYSGPAAVFAMGPGGQLLLSHAHSSGLVHISSLFAGHPVAGAGEIVVEDGVVKRIIACSVAYWPDIKLNKQVVDELYRRGYDNADEIK